MHRGWVDIDFQVPSFCSPPQPIRPDYQLIKQNGSGSGILKINVNPTWVHDHLPNLVLRCIINMGLTAFQARSGSSDRFCTSRPSGTSPGAASSASLPSSWASHSSSSVSPSTHTTARTRHSGTCITVTEDEYMYHNTYHIPIVYAQ